MDKLNSLPDLLRRLGVGRDARVLDIGSDDGASVDYLVEAVDGVVDVVPANKTDRDRAATQHGKRVRFLDSEYAAAANSYDLVIVSPVLAKLAENLRDTAWRAPRLLKPGGVWITFGIDPKTLDAKGYHQPSKAAADDFCRDFAVRGGKVRGLPEALAGRFELAAWTPRKPIQRSYLTWTALRMLKATKPRRMRVFTDVRAHSLIDDLPPAAHVEAAVALAREFEPDTLMVVDNEVLRDARVSKTAETVRDLGRRVLCIGIHDRAAVELQATRGDVPVLLYPSPRLEIERRLLLVGGPIDQAVRRELRMAAYGRWLAGLIEALGPKDLSVHSHDFQALYVVGAARELAKARLPWVHDSHEFIARYELIDPAAQAVGVLWERHYLPQVDAHTCVSEEQAEGIKAEYGVDIEAVIYNTQRLTARHKHHGRSIRERLGVGKAPLLVHSGSIREGRGVEHLIRVMPDFPDVNLALLTGSKGPFMKALLKEADRLGVRKRVHLCTPLPYDEAAGFIADADAGVIPMDSYGNAEMSLPNKLFDYILAGLPVLSSSTRSLRRLFDEWPIGPMYAPSDEAGLRAALKDLLANRDGYAAEVEKRPDLLVKHGWEAQAVKMQQLYARLPLAAKGRVR